MPNKFVTLLAVALGLLAFTCTVTPVSALSTGYHNRLNRQANHGYIAKRSNGSNTSTTKRCKKKPSSPASSSASPTATPPPETHAAAPSSSKAAPSSSQTHASSTPAPAPPTDNGNKKIGLAWPNGRSDLANFITENVGWIYTWSPEQPDSSRSDNYGLEFMPMLWGPNQISSFQKAVKPGYADYILGFNEPNEAGQSNLDPGYAASLWKQYIEPLRASGYKTCSPATSSNPNGYTWVQNFLKACDGGCTFDCVAIHWYDVKFEDFKAYTEKWHDGFGKDILITEFAPQNFNGGAQLSPDGVWNFYQQAMPYIMQTPWIKAAFPFGFMHDMSGVNMADQLMSSDGKPNPLGAFIISGNY
ncbi:hypothetical protein BDW22DRAFT_1350998 [Trametopsis cervina]|nr:hypothetical protein BDW22DRAFT_1350998 [Trametopsis cervina]